MSSSTTGESENNTPVSCEMDIFSLGCVIAELFLEEPLFSLQELLEYRATGKDSTSVSPLLSPKSMSDEGQDQQQQQQQIGEHGGFVALSNGNTHRMDQKSTVVNNKQESSFIHVLPQTVIDKLKRLPNKQISQLIQGMIQYDPAARISVDTAMKMELFPVTFPKLLYPLHINALLWQHRVIMHKSVKRRSDPSLRTKKQVQSFRFNSKFSFVHNCSNASDARIDMLCEQYENIVNSFFV